MSNQPGFNSFKEFYPFYLEEHSEKVNRTLHFIGTTLLIIVFVFAILTRNFRLLWLCPLIGYGFAWVGHIVFEKNRPATFKHPLYSLRADFTMWWQLLIRKIYF
jgi:hypothetical protein